MLVRILFGHLPDRIGGIPVALGSIAIEAAEQYLLWTVFSPAMALTGPATGLLADRFRYGVVFPIGGLAASLGSRWL